MKIFSNTFLDLSVRQKIILLTVGIITVLGILVYSYVKSTLEARLFSELLKRGVSVTNAVAQDGIDFVLSDNFGELHLLLDDRKESDNDIEYIFVVDEHGNVISSTFENGFPEGLLQANPSTPGQAVSIQHIVSEKGDLQDIRVPMLKGWIGAVHVGFSHERIKKNIAGDLSILRFIIFGVLIFGCLTAIFVSGIITLPLFDLSEMAKAVGAGNLNRKVTVRTNDELGKLGTTFNAMTEALRKTTVSRDYIGNIVNSMTDTLIVVDEKSDIETVNKALLDLLGYREDELIGKPSSVVFVRDHPYDEAQWDMLKVVGYMIGLEKEYRAKDGRMVPVFLSASVMDDPSRQQGIVYVAQDNTYRINSENEKERLRELLTVSEKMSAVGRLAGGIAHDFNNLLTAISGGAEFGLSMVKKGDPLAVELFEIKQAGERAAALTQQLLSFSRKHPVQVRPVNLNETVTRLLSMIKRLIGEDITVLLRLSPQSLTVKTDEDKIMQVLMNLAVNAKDAMPKGGRLTIRTELADVSREESGVIPGASAGRFARLAVEDTGSGMDEETVKHIFEPFFTTKDVGKGTGLGLAVAYSIVQQHGGWINVYSNPGAGTTFRIYLPLSEEQAEEKISAKQAVKTPSGAGRRIMLVEDEKAVSDFAERVLKQYGYTIIKAASKNEAISQFEKERRSVDLVFSDSVLPDGSGVEVVEHILSLAPGTPVLLTSGYLDDKSQWDTIQKKNYRFLPKPYAITDMLQAVSALISPQKNRIDSKLSKK